MCREQEEQKQEKREKNTGRKEGIIR